jgi:hypothetical protein
MILDISYRSDFQFKHDMTGFCPRLPVRQIQFGQMSSHFL